MQRVIPCGSFVSKWRSASSRTTIFTSRAMLFEELPRIDHSTGLRIIEGSVVRTGERKLLNGKSR